MPTRRQELQACDGHFLAPQVIARAKQAGFSVFPGEHFQGFIIWCDICGQLLASCSCDLDQPLPEGYVQKAL